MAKALFNGNNQPIILHLGLECFDSIGRRSVDFFAVVGSYAEFSKGAQDLPAGILRSKGFLKFGDKVKLFNRTMSRVNIDDIKDLSIPDALIDKLIVIYPHDTAAAVDAYLQRQCCFKRLPGSLKNNRLIPFGLTRSVKG